MPKQLVWAAGLLLALVAGIGFWLGLSGSRPSGAPTILGAGALSSISSARNAVAEATAPMLDEAAVRRIVHEEMQGSKAPAPAVKKSADSSAPAAPASSAHAASSAPAAAPAPAPPPAVSPPPPPAQSAAPPILY